MIQFYTPDIATNPTLPPEEARHAIRVLRMRPGDELSAVDGKGQRVLLRILNEGPHQVEVKVMGSERVERSWQPEITLAVAPTKNADRMEWLVEKLVEIGIDAVVPLLCRHSERKVMKTDRLERIAVAAMKQSLKAVLPQIAPLTPIGSFIGDCASEERFICYCDERVERVPLVAAHRPEAHSVAILIGPEGDFAPEEVQAALAAGFKPVSLGPNRLRTETAALVAVDTIHIINQLSQSKQK